jgi:microcystin-dependent protein
MSLPALHAAADTRSITERVNVLIRDYTRRPQRLVPPGTVLPFAGATAPEGFLLCDGSAVSRTDYADLFAAIGTTHGAGNGSTTFNLPDLRGRVAAGKDNMGGTAANRITNGGSGVAGTTLGAVGGAEMHTLTTAQMPAHGHGVSDPSHAHAVAAGNAVSGLGVTGRASWGDGNFFSTFLTNSVFTGVTIQNAGGGGAHNNTQPTIILNYVIGT